MIVVQDRIKMSFGFAADVAKQLIALSTAIITLCVALADKLFSSQAIKSNTTILLIALGFFVLSILMGLLCLMAITGTLGRPVKNDSEAGVGTSPGGRQDDANQQNANNKSKNSKDGTIYQTNICLFSIAQIFLFMGGIAMSAVFIYLAATSNSLAVDGQRKETSHNEIRVKRTSNYTVIDSIKVDTLLVNSNGYNPTKR